MYYQMLIVFFLYKLYPTNDAGNIDKKSGFDE